MGVMDKFLNYMKLNDEEDEGFYDDDYLDDEEEVEPVKKFSPAKSRQQAQEDDEPEEKSKRSSQPKVTPIHRTVTKKMPGTGMEVCVIKPTSVEDAREITETLLANRTVVLNLEGLDVDIASVSLTLLPDPVSQYRVIYRKYPIIFSLLRRPA